MSYVANCVDFADLILELLGDGVSVQFIPERGDSPQRVKLTDRVYSASAAGRPMDALREAKAELVSLRKGSRNGS